MMYHSILEEGGHGGGDGDGDDAESQNGVCDFGVLAVFVEDEEGDDVCEDGPAVEHADLMKVSNADKSLWGHSQANGLFLCGSLC